MIIFLLSLLIWWKGYNSGQGLTLSWHPECQLDPSQLDWVNLAPSHLDNAHVEMDTIQGRHTCEKVCGGFVWWCISEVFWYNSGRGLTSSWLTLGASTWPKSTQPSQLGPQPSWRCARRDARNAKSTHRFRISKEVDNYKSTSLQNQKNTHTHTHTFTHTAKRLYGVESTLNESIC